MRLLRHILPAILPAVALMAQDEPTVVFRSDVSLVRVDVQALDRSNRAITGLQTEDFVLTEAGQPREIRNFATESMPVDVLLLLDVSGSMRPHLQRIAAAGEEALAVLGKDDRVGVMVFDRMTRLRLPFRTNKREVERELQALLDHETFAGGTDITRALYDAARHLQQQGRAEARRAIVIVTDDQTEFAADESGVLRALTRADVVLSALIAPNAIRGGRGGSPGGGRGGIQLPLPWPGGGWPGGGGWPTGGGSGRRGPMGGSAGTNSAGTATIARDSGGDSFPVDDASALENTLERLRQRYALYFQLPPGVRAGEERNIDVKLASAALRRHQGAELRFRRTYVPPSGTEPDQVSSGPTGQPTVVADATASADPPVSTGGTRSQRRPAVNETGGSSGPRSAEGGGWRRVDEPASNPQGGWRRVEDPAPAEPPASEPADSDRPVLRRKP